MPRIHRLRALIPALGALFVLAACGRKEPPLPPPSRVPAAPAEVRAEQRGDEIFLNFLFPTTTIGGLALESFVAADVYELVRDVPPGFFDEPEEDEAEEGEAEEDDDSEDADESTEGKRDRKTKEDADDEDDEDSEEKEDEDDSKPKKRKKRVFTVDKSEFRSAAQVRVRLEGAELASATRGDRISTRFRLTDISEDPLTAHIFGIKILVDEEKLISPFSKLVTIVPKTPPPPTTDLKIKALARGVQLDWSSDTTARVEEDEASEEGVEEVAAPANPNPEREIVGFHVYRRLAQEPGFDLPLERVDPDKRNFLDRKAPYDSRFVYAVTAIRETGPLIESAIVEEREIDYRDTFPPPIPSNVAALAETGRVRVLWTPQPSENLAGYLVYRSGADGTEKLMTPIPISDTEYIDTEVRSGEQLVYFVVSIDTAGNRSGRSDTTETIVP